VLATIEEEPNSVTKEVELIESKFWKDSMVEEMKSLYKDEMWDLVKLTNGRKLIRRKWVFNKKKRIIGQV
jgi:hypothetical protein